MKFYDKHLPKLNYYFLYQKINYVNERIFRADDIRLLVAQKCITFMLFSDYSNLVTVFQLHSLCTLSNTTESSTLSIDVSLFYEYIMNVNTIITLNEYFIVLFFFRNESLQTNKCLLYIGDIIVIYNIKVNIALLFMNYE